MASVHGRTLQQPRKMLLQAEREPNPLLDRQLVDPLPFEFRGTLDTAAGAGAVMGSRSL